MKKPKKAKKRKLRNSRKRRKSKSGGNLKLKTMENTSSKYVKLKENKRKTLKSRDLSD